MAHSTVLGVDGGRTYTAIHNGDYSGFVQVHISHPDPKRVKQVSIPFWMLESLVGDKLRNEQIEKIEDLTGREYLESLKENS